MKKKKKERKMMRICSTRSTSAQKIVVNGAPVPTVRVVIFFGNICSECNKDVMKFERHPK
jgi:hypothetical protein